MNNPFSLKDTYKDVYIINFKKGVVPPKVTEKELKKLGEWFKTSGNTWICHSEVTIEDFRVNFLAHFSETLKDDDFEIKKGTWPVVGNRPITRYIEKGSKALSTLEPFSIYKLS